jgi:hypothetical protein
MTWGGADGPGLSTLLGMSTLSGLSSLSTLLGMSTLSGLSSLSTLLGQRFFTPFRMTWGVQNDVGHPEWLSIL